MYTTMSILDLIIIRMKLILILATIIMELV
jgi:hypothetical protein